MKNKDTKIRIAMWLRVTLFAPIVMLALMIPLSNVFKSESQELSLKEQRAIALHMERFERKMEIVNLWIEQSQDVE